MFANEGSNRPYKLIGIGEGHHDLSHHERNPEKQEKIRQINRFHVEQLAYILNKMQSIKEGDGTLQGRRTSATTTTTCRSCLPVRAGARSRAAGTFATQRTRRSITSTSR